METLTARHFRFADFELDAAKRLLLKEGKPVTLNSKTFDLLLALVEHHGEVLSKEQLLEMVWAGQFVEEGNLTVQVSTLRKIFGETKNEHRFIVTVPGRGYSFVAELDEDTKGEIVLESHRYSHIVVENKETIADDVLDRRDNAASDHARSPSTYPAIRQKQRVLVTLSVLALAAAGWGYWFFTRSPSTSISVESIAVMPFVNESGDADIEYLSDGMTESLINGLSRLPKLSVKARSSVFRYKGKDILPTEVGSDLKVEAVLNGRVVKVGDQLVLYLSLVDARTGNQIWGDQYNRKITDLLSLQNEIARDVSQKLKTKLSGSDEQTLAKNFTENAEAFRFYLKGRYFWNKFTPADHLKAAEYFRQAIIADPGYALAYVGLADVYGASAANSWIPPKEGYPKAKAAIRKALEIDDTLANAHASLGAMYMFSDLDWNAAEREYKLALELDPNYAITHAVYSYLLTALRRHDEAIAEAQRALELDPLSATFSDDLALAYCLARRYDEAIKQNMKTLEIEPDRPDTLSRLGNIYDQKGMYQEAVAAYQKAISRSERTSNFLGWLGHAYAASGRRKEAVKILDEMTEMSKQKYVSPYDFAILYTGLGEKGKALEQLNHAYEERSSWIINLQVDPFLGPLRDDPRFQQLMNRAGF